MNKAELIDAVAETTGTDKKATGAVVESMVDTVLRAVASGERVAITGFGVFEKRERAARTARNPRTGVAIRLKKTSVPAFRPGQGFKDVVSGATRLTKSTTAKRASSATGAKAAAKKTTARKTTAKAAKKTTARKAPAKKVVARKVVAKKAPARKVAAKKAPAKKAPGKKVAAKKSPAKKAKKR